jgi:sugar phosphate isomerase/epimerase
MGKLGLQLYTLREIAAQDFLGTLSKVAEVGYQGVEFSGYYETAAQSLRAALRDTGLEVAGSIVQLEVLENDLDGAIEYCRTIDCPMIICPWLAEEYRTAAAYRRIGGRFGYFGARCRANGIRFLYHIHGYEFEDLGGQCGMDILFSACDPALVNFEVDVYWLEYAGVDAVEFMRSHGQRCPYIHFKDMTDKVSKHDTEVGAGAIDMRGVMREGKKHGAEWFIVEQEAFDIPPLESIAISLRNLRRLAEEV